MQPYQIYVISLPHSTDRRKTISDHLNKLNLKFTFFDATYGKNINKKNYPNFIGINNELGCLLSHYNLIKSIKDSTKPVLILEDDAVITGDISTVKPPDNFDLLFMGHCLTKDLKKVYDNIYKSYNIFCTHGYLISPSGIKKMLNYFNNDNFLYPIDTIYDYLSRYNYINSYIVHPAIINTSGQESTIKSLNLIGTINHTIRNIKLDHKYRFNFLFVILLILFILYLYFSNLFKIHFIFIILLIFFIIYLFYSGNFHII
jgi:GR25 family glycosyltransferase involved in LPS biosynthesis